MAGAHGSRTHRATPGAAPPVLKTGEPTGTPPLPERIRVIVSPTVRPGLSSADDDRVPHRRLPPIRLTELTECGGCAAKLGADLLADALSGLGAGTDHDPALIAGLEPPDDAAAYRVSDDLAILGTLDFFPPLVDDPAAYGEIAAANALSDVFAMGGRVLFALSIAAFPEDFPS